MNAPTSKNVICLEIMDRPQVRSSKVELLLLVTVVCFDSYPQLFQLFNQRFQHHIEAWTTFQIGHRFWSGGGVVHKRNLGAWLVRVEREW
jgi:hypothetical protein